MSADKPRLLDLFCGAGGAAKGYQRAGFYVVGVDINPQPHYCGDEFYQADALTFPLEGFDAIHASPPCQAYSALKNRRVDAGSHLDLIPAVRARLHGYDVPWVIENVVGAPLNTLLMLCGSMFDLRSSRGYLQRHRWFESNTLIMSPGPCRHEGQAIGVYGHGSGGLFGLRMRTAGADESRELMGMPWATRDGCSQAIPPAYTEYIGAQLIAVVAYRNRAEAAL